MDDLQPSSANEAASTLASLQTGVDAPTDTAADDVAAPKTDEPDTAPAASPIDTTEEAQEHHPETSQVSDTQEAVAPETEGSQTQVEDESCMASEHADSLSSVTSIDPFAETVKRLTARDKTKLAVRFRAIGNAPIMKENKFQISASQRFHTIMTFLRKELRLSARESLFLYVSSAFAPAPDEIVSNLYKCFQVDGQLIISYCITPAWG